VRVGHVTAYPKSGAIGVLVRIVPPGTVFPDKVVTKIELPKVIAAAADLSPPEERAAIAPSAGGVGGVAKKALDKREATEKSEAEIEAQQQKEKRRFQRKR